VIDLSKVQSVLDDVLDLTDELHGADHRDSGDNRGPKREREARVQQSRQLQLLADRLILAHGLVMNEYWVARGESDPLNRNREGGEE
jgi:hypothetical protein